MLRVGEGRGNEIEEGRMEKGEKVIKGRPVHENQRVVGGEVK